MQRRAFLVASSGTVLAALADATAVPNVLFAKDGASLVLESFAFSRVDPQSCYLRIADRRIEGVPLFDAAFTDEDGVRGRLGPFGGDAEIGLAETEPFRSWNPAELHASDDELEESIVTAMEKEGLVVNAKARHDTAARGEAGPVQRGERRFITIACDSEAFHNVADRWPEAIDVALLARYARAIPSAALTLARQQR